MYRRASEPVNAGGNIRSGQAGNIKLNCVTEWGAGEKLKQNWYEKHFWETFPVRAWKAVEK